jgi:nitronate monooxygenase/enoyl-[acyl-carrier protein] reductase II
MNDLCSLLGIEVPIVLAPFGPWEEVELAAAVCNAGGLGSLGTALRSTDELRQQWDRLRELTDRPFVINHTGRPLNQEAFEATLEAGPAAISFHLGIPAELIARAHDHGILWIQAVGDLDAAEVALAAGADVLVAQGTEAGGNAGWVSTLVLVPAVVDLAGTTPVVAAGGIADGRGIAAALVLGAQGVSLGTRFLATTEMAIDQAWKDRIVAAHARDAIKVANSDRALPPFTLPQVGAPFTPRALRTPLTEQLEQDPDSVDPQALGAQVRAEVLAGRGHDLLPFTGQSTELIHDILPAADLITRLLTECTSALQQAQTVMPDRVSRP